MAWVQFGRFPSEIRALPQGERAFMMAASQVSGEQQKKATPAPGQQPSGNAGRQPSQAAQFRKDVIE